MVAEQARFNTLDDETVNAQINYFQAYRVLEKKYLSTYQNWQSSTNKMKIEVKPEGNEQG